MGRSLFEPPTDYEIISMACLLTSEDALLSCHSIPFTKTVDKCETARSCTILKQSRGRKNFGIINSVPIRMKLAPASEKNASDTHFELFSRLPNVDVGGTAWNSLEEPSKTTRKHHFDPDELYLLEQSNRAKLLPLSAFQAVEKKVSIHDSCQDLTLSQSFPKAAWEGIALLFSPFLFEAIIVLRK